MSNYTTWAGMDVREASIVVTAVSHDSDRAIAQLTLGDRATSGASAVPGISEDDEQREKLPADGRIRGPGIGRFRVGDWKIPLIA